MVIYTTGAYTVPSPNAIYLWRGRAGFPTWVSDVGNPELETPHSDPVPAVSATQFELVEAPYNEMSFLRRP